LIEICYNKHDQIEAVSGHFGKIKSASNIVFV